MSAVALAPSAGLPGSLEQLERALREAPPATVGVLGASGEDSRAALAALTELGVGRVEVFGDGDDAQAGVEEAARLWAAGSLDLLLKLELPTSVVMREVLRVAEGSWFAHLGLVLDAELPPFLIADAGLNRSPGIDELEAIATRAIAAAQQLGVERPLVGLLAHREAPDAAVPGSLLLGELREQRGAALEAAGARLLGPTSLDLALDPAAAAAKGEDLARTCDVLLVPDIIVGNVLYKAFMLRCDCLVAGVVYDGGEKAVAVPSRAASTAERIAAAALAVALKRNSPEPRSQG